MIDQASKLSLKDMNSIFGEDAYYELNACEWAFGDEYAESFQELNNLIYEIDDALFHTGFEPERLMQFFEDLLIEVLSQLKAAGAFSRGGFEKDVLLGIQFSDPDIGELNIMERVSKALNSSS